MVVAGAVDLAAAIWGAPSGRRTTVAEVATDGEAEEAGNRHDGAFRVWVSRHLKM